MNRRFNYFPPTCCPASQADNAPCCSHINLPFARQLLRDCGLTPFTNPDNGLQGGRQGAQARAQTKAWAPGPVNHCPVTTAHIGWGSQTGPTQSLCLRSWSKGLRSWRRLLRVPSTARRSNQSILKKINLEYSLERLMLKLKLKL